MTTSVPAVRTLTVAYGSVTTGSGAYHIDATPGRLVWAVSPSEARLTWHVAVHGASSASDLETACDLLEAEFAKRFLRLRVVNDSQEWLDWDPSDDSGFLAVPSIERIDHPAQTSRSRMYRCSVAVQLPADDNTGRRWASIEVAIDDGGVKTVTIRGQYTSQAGVAARANYEAKIDTFANAALSAIGGNYNLPAETASADDQNKLLDFTRTYRQIVYSETASGNIAGILSHGVTYSLDWEGPGDTPGGPYGEANRLQVVTANYVAGVDARVTTALETLWSGTLRDYVVQQANSAYPGACSIAAESVACDRTNNKITASVRLNIASVGGLLEYRATQEYDNKTGKTVVPVWSGNRYAKRVYQGPSDTFRTTTATWRAISAGALGTVQGRSLAQGSVERGGGGQLLGGSSGWVLIGEVQSSSPVRIGILARGRTITVWESSIRYVEQWVVGVGGGTVQTSPGSSGGGAAFGSPQPAVTPGGGVIR